METPFVMMVYEIRIDCRDAEMSGRNEKDTKRAEKKARVIN